MSGRRLYLVVSGSLYLAASSGPNDPKTRWTPERLDARVFARPYEAYQAAALFWAGDVVPL